MTDNSRTSLDNISVASPCSASWAEMKGDERARHCELCKKNVYNLSDMTRAQAEALIVEKEGKLCVRFYRRADGTVLTDNCPLGLRAVRRRLKWIGAGVAALFTLGSAAVFARASAAGGSSSVASLRSTKPFDTLQNVQPFKMLIDYVDPPSNHMVVGMMLAPRICPTQPAPTSTTAK